MNLNLDTIHLFLSSLGFIINYVIVNQKTNFKGPKMSDKKVTIQELKDIIQDFMNARDWTQFHNPKNLTISITLEAAELMEHFQWTDIEQSIEKANKNSEEIKEEVADIVILIMRFCNLYNIDLSQAIIDKMEKNGKKYPIEKCKGKSDKYTKYV